jgi:hypothetical protein
MVPPGRQQDKNKIRCANFAEGAATTNQFSRVLIPSRESALEWEARKDPET